MQRKLMIKKCKSFHKIKIKLNHLLIKAKCLLLILNNIPHQVYLMKVLIKILLIIWVRNMREILIIKTYLSYQHTLQYRRDKVLIESNQSIQQKDKHLENIYNIKLYSYEMNKSNLS